MIKSELLDEKYRVQSELSQKYSTVEAYLDHADLVAKEIAEKYGFSLKYVKQPSNKINLAAIQKSKSDPMSVSRLDKPDTILSK